MGHLKCNGNLRRRPWPICIELLTSKLSQNLSKNHGQPISRRSNNLCACWASSAPAKSTSCEESNLVKCTSQGSSGPAISIRLPSRGPAATSPAEKRFLG